MNAQQIYQGSNGEHTKAFYAELVTRGPLGTIAVNLFRAQKCSERAKLYRGRRYKEDAYDRKNWSLGELCKALREDSQGILWGWGEDETTPGFEFVLYADLPQGQVSFHSRSRGPGPDYQRPWDGQRGKSPERIIAFCQAVLDNQLADMITAHADKTIGGEEGCGPGFEPIHKRHDQPTSPPIEQLALF